MGRFLMALALGCAAMAAYPQAKPGPIADKVVFDVKMDQMIAIKDVAEGKSDVFMYGLDSRVYRAISEVDRAKLDVYAVPSGSWSIKVNPVPNKAPYTVSTKAGKTYFNPFAIREVRYALNWLIDRKRIVDEILLGDGDPMFTHATPGQPGTYQYNLLAAKLGMTPRGNEKKAIADIDAAMQAAAGLPENAGKLSKKGQWWTYAGEPVTVKFLIRVDDPQGRLLEGRYIADQIEKAGIKVERLEWDRTKCINLSSREDPANYDWSLYTEGWGAGATRKWWSQITSQMWAPYYANMPGGMTEGFWNYENPEIDRLAIKSYYGWFLTADDFWRDELKAVSLGMQDSVRIYIASQMQYFVANKARFNARMLYGLGDGLNGWSIASADVKPNDKGEKILRVSQFSARGGLFMSAWDPVGTEGFNDQYANNVADPCSDKTAEEGPDASLNALRGVWDKSKMTTKIVSGGDGKAPVGQVKVDPRAVIYDSRKDAWVSGLEYRDLGDGKFGYAENAAATAYSKAETGYKYAKWHSGERESVADLMYFMAFKYEWANEDFPGDKEYEASYASSYQPTIAGNKGVVLKSDRDFDVYFDYNWPMDLEYQVTQGGVLENKVGAPGQPPLVSWEIAEALARLVVEGSKSGTVYSFSGDTSTTEVDLISPKCVADIRAKLDELAARRHVPASIRQWCKPEEAVARYRAALRFIDTYKHAFVSNGAFFVSKVDTSANFVELSAFRDPAYPFKSDHWPRHFKAELTRIGEVKLASSASRSQDLACEISVSTMFYPEDKPVPADSRAVVTLLVVSSDGSERTYPAKFVKPGSFRAVVPAKDLSVLKPGSCTMVVQSSLKGEMPSIVPTSVLLY